MDDSIYKEKYQEKVFNISVNNNQLEPNNNYTTPYN